MSEFAKTLEKLMRERNVTPKVLYEACGVAPSTLSEWRRGRHPKFDGSLLKLARFFGVSLEFLLTGHEPEEELVDNLTDLEDCFITIHRGVYRVRVERFTGKKK